MDDATFQDLKASVREGGERLRSLNAARDAGVIDGIVAQTQYAGHLILVVAGRAEVVHAVIAPALIEKLPASMYYRERMRIDTGDKVQIHFAVVREAHDIDRIRGYRYDHVYFWPDWGGSQLMHDEICGMAMRRHSRR